MDSSSWHVAAAAASCSARGTRFLSQPDHARVEEERESVLAAKPTVVQAQAAHEEHEAIRLFTEEAAAEAAASVTAALDCWQFVWTSRRRAVEASKKSAEALNETQQESDGVLGNLLKSVEDFDKQVHSITTREDSLVFGADGGFENAATRWKGSLHGDPPCTA